MRKLFVVLLVLAMLISVLTSCQNTSDDGSGTTESTSTSESSTSASESNTSASESNTSASESNTTVSVPNKPDVEKVDSAAKLMEKIDQKMESLKSYQSDMTIDLTTELEGMICEALFTAQNISIDDEPDVFYYYDGMEGVMRIKDKEQDALISELRMRSGEAFHNGKMFVWNEENGVVQKLYSPLSKQDYIAYLEKQENTLDIDFNQCVNSIFTENEDKTWTLQYSGYTKKVVDAIVREFGEELFQEEIMDMEITIHANQDFTVKDMEIKMIFENESTDSEFRICAQYSKYDQATEITDTLNPADYHEIMDCRLLKDFGDMFENIENVEDGYFELDLRQALEVSRPVQKQTIIETDAVNYGRSNGKYFYAIKATYNGSNIDILYENGQQTVIANGVSETAVQTEEEAIAFINGLINTASYHANRVSDIKQLEDGSYEIVCDHPDESLYQPIFSSMGAPVTSLSQTITITLQDGKIVCVVSKLIASGYSDTYGTVTFQLSSVNVYDYPPVD